jgi:HEAT repeat protein
VPSTTKLSLLATSLIVPTVLLAMNGAAFGQVDTYKAVERYNRVAKGSNIAEWHRRLFDADPNVRLEAVESLGQSNSEDAVKPLLDATSDSDPRVRAKAIDYLGTLGSERATQVLTQYLFLSDTDRASKQRVLVALGRIGDPAAVGSLVAFLERTGDDELRCGALYALGEIGDPKALEAVQSFNAAENANVKRIAAQAAIKINAKVAAIPNNQPTILELERRLRPPEQQQ